MADRTVFPTEDWRWPLDNLAGVEALTKEAEHALTLGGVIGVAVSQLRRDRDELVTALESIVFNVKAAPGVFPAASVADAGRTLARIKGG